MQLGSITLRPEVLYLGCAPVWTNAAPSMRQCPRCWTWQPEADFRDPLSMCRTCRQDLVTETSAAREAYTMPCAWCRTAFQPRHDQYLRQHRGDTQRMFCSSRHAFLWLLKAQQRAREQRARAEKRAAQAHYMSCMRCGRDFLPSREALQRYRQQPNRRRFCGRTCPALARSQVRRDNKEIA